jgi:hypothetical protein
MLRSKFNKLSK